MKLPLEWEDDHAASLRNDDTQLCYFGDETFTVLVLGSIPASSEAFGIWGMTDKVNFF
jgi:hypothetical protein